MKTLLLASLLVATSALADSVTLAQNGKSVVIQGLSKSTSQEIFQIVGKAYDEYFKNYQTGEEYFTRTSDRRGSMGKTKYANAVLTASSTSGITLNYKVTFVAKKKDKIELVDAKTLKISGEAANILKGALAYSAKKPAGPMPVGASITKSISGKIVCSKVVSPKAVASCTIAL